MPNDVNCAKGSPFNDKGVVINYGEGGTKREKFYPYKKKGGGMLSPPEGGGVGRGGTKSCKAVLKQVFEDLNILEGCHKIFSSLQTGGKNELRQYARYHLVCYTLLPACQIMVVYQVTTGTNK